MLSSSDLKLKEFVMLDFRAKPICKLLSFAHHSLSLPSSVDRRCARLIECIGCKIKSCALYSNMNLKHAGTINHLDLLCTVKLNLCFQLIHYTSHVSDQLFLASVL